MALNIDQTQIEQVRCLMAADKRFQQRLKSEDCDLQGAFALEIYLGDDKRSSGFVSSNIGKLQVTFAALGGKSIVFDPILSIVSDYGRKFPKAKTRGGTLVRLEENDKVIGAVVAMSESDRPQAYIYAIPASLLLAAKR